MSNICVPRTRLGKTVIGGDSVGGRKEVRLMQCHSSHSNYLKKQKFVKIVKSCREIKVGRKGLLELDIRNALVIFKCAVSGCVRGGKSSITFKKSR